MGNVWTASSRIFVIASHYIDVIVAIEQLECVADLRMGENLGRIRQPKIDMRCSANLHCFELGSLQHDNQAFFTRSNVTCAQELCRQSELILVLLFNFELSFFAHFFFHSASNLHTE